MWSKTLTISGHFSYIKAVKFFWVVIRRQVSKFLWRQIKFIDLQIYLDALVSLPDIIS